MRAPGSENYLESNLGSSTLARISPFQGLEARSTLALRTTFNAAAGHGAPPDMARPFESVIQGMHVRFVRVAAFSISCREPF